MDKEKVIKRINALKQKEEYSDLEYYVQAIEDVACLCILKCNSQHLNPNEYMKSAVTSVVKHDRYIVMDENNLKNPYVKIIFFDFNEIKFSKK